MTAFLPPNLLALFAARDPIPYLPPTDKLSHEKKRNGYGGVAQYLTNFEDPKDTPPPTRVETKDERKERKRKERAEQIAYKLEQDLALWDPHTTNPNTDPYKTLFVARINYDTSESKIRREFEVYGPIRKIKVAADKFSGKPRGYAFIEYEHERDMHSAYKHADGKKIDGRRVLVDVERGRTVKGWRPRRLGGGLGGTRKGGPEENTRFSGRDDYSRESFRGERDRDRVERPERSASRDRGGGERRERDAVPERADRGERRRRSRSRDRRRRSRSRDRKRDRTEEKPDEKEKEEEKDKEKSDRKKRSRRSRSRDRGDKKRSRSRDRKKSRRSRSRDRKRKDEDSQGPINPQDGNDDMPVEFPEGGIKQEVMSEMGDEDGYQSQQMDQSEDGQYGEADD